MMQQSDEADEAACQQPESVAGHRPDQGRAAQGKDARIRRHARGAQCGGVRIDPRRRLPRARRIGAMEKIDRIRGALTPVQRGERRLASARRRRQQRLEFVEQWFPRRVVEMRHTVAEPRIDLLRERAHRAMFVAGVHPQPPGGVDRPADLDPHRAAKAFLPLVVDADGHDAQANRAGGDRLQGEPGGARPHHRQPRGVVALALGKDAHHASGRELPGRRGERFQIFRDLARVITSPIRGHHAERAQRRAEDRDRKQRRLRHQPHGPLGRDAQEHRIDERVGVVRHKQHRTGARDEFAAGDLDARVVELRERAHGAAQQADFFRRRHGSGTAEQTPAPGARQAPGEECLQPRSRRVGPRNTRSTRKRSSLPCVPWADKPVAA